MNAPSASPAVSNTTISRVRGSSVPMIAAAARAAMGEGAWRTLLGELTPKARALLEYPPPLDEWQDATVVAECLVKFHQRAGSLGNVPGILGAETHRARQPMAFQEPAALLAALPGFWLGSAQGGLMEGEFTGPTSAEIRIRALWPVPYFFDVHAPAWFFHGFSLLGVGEIGVEYLPPQAGDPSLHTYHIHWA